MDMTRKTLDLKNRKEVYMVPICRTFQLCDKVHLKTSTCKNKLLTKSQPWVSSWHIHSLDILIKRFFKKKKNVYCYHNIRI